MRMKESTYVKYINLTSNHILPLLGNLEIRSYTSPHHSELVFHNKKSSPDTSERYSGRFLHISSLYAK